MADTVKISLMKSIETAIGAMTVSGATEFPTVIRNPSKPIDPETASFPIVFLFDDTENKVRRNRVADITMPIQIEIWCKEHEDSSGDQLDIYNADIEKELLSNVTVKTWAKVLEPDTGASFAKQYVDEFLSIGISKWICRFLTVWGDPYDIGRQ